MKYLLDTGTCIYALKQHRGVLDRLLQESPDDVAVSAMTAAELAFGALKSRKPEQAKVQVDAFLEPLSVLPFDREAAARHAEIRFALRGAPIGERDLVIASVAAAAALVLVTHNRREFGRVPGIEIEDWADEFAHEAGARYPAPRRRPTRSRRREASQAGTDRERGL